MSSDVNSLPRSSRVSRISTRGRWRRRCLRTFVVVDAVALSPPRHHPFLLPRHHRGSHLPTSTSSSRRKETRTRPVLVVVVGLHCLLFAMSLSLSSLDGRSSRGGGEIPCESSTDHPYPHHSPHRRRDSPSRRPCSFFVRKTTEHPSFFVDSDRFFRLHIPTVHDLCRCL